jgi:hypothetical protein
MHRLHLARIVPCGSHSLVSSEDCRQIADAVGCEPGDDDLKFQKPIISLRPGLVLL